MIHGHIGHCGQLIRSSNGHFSLLLYYAFVVCYTNMQYIVCIPTSDKWNVMSSVSPNQDPLHNTVLLHLLDWYREWKQGKQSFTKKGRGKQILILFPDYTSLSNAQLVIMCEYLHLRDEAQHYDQNLFLLWVLSKACFGKCDAEDFLVPVICRGT